MRVWLDPAKVASACGVAVGAPHVARGVGGRATGARPGQAERVERPKPGLLREMTWEAAEAETTDDAQSLSPGDRVRLVAVLTRAAWEGVGRERERFRRFYSYPQASSGAVSRDRRLRDGPSRTGARRTPWTCSSRRMKRTRRACVPPAAVAFSPRACARTPGRDRTRAHTGDTTKRCTRLVDLSAVHAHVRGDDETISRVIDAASGSRPRAWGAIRWCSADPSLPRRLGRTQTSSTLRSLLKSVGSSADAGRFARFSR
jgi:hypothetical protein